MLLSFAVLFCLYRLAKWLLEKLFGKDGVIGIVVSDHRAFLRSMETATAAHGANFGRLSDHMEALQALILRALAPRLEDGETWRIVFAESPTAVGLIAEDGTFLHANYALQTFLGWTEAELRAKKWQEITAPESAQATEAAARAMIQDGTQSFRMPKVYVAKNGTKKAADIMVFRYPGRGDFRNFVLFVSPATA